MGVRVGAVGWGTALQAAGVIGIFHWLNPSGHIMALRSNQLHNKWVPGEGVKAAGA